MQNRWNDEDAARAVRDAGPDAADQALALRVYTSRLIGGDPDLVMHGGGNTSVKAVRRDLLGRGRAVLHVKGSGWDLATIEAPGLPGVWLDPLLELRALDALGDEEMVAAQRQNLIDPASPNPSVETLLHAFLPHTFVDHTHATAMLAIADQPDVRAVAQRIYGDRVAVVDYVMPGFALAKAAADALDANPNVEGLLLARHGHFTFGPDARTSYERMIAHVREAEAFIEAQAVPDVATHEAPSVAAAEVLPRLRGAIAASSPFLPVFDVRRSEVIDRFLTRADLDSVSRRGVATPDHVIRTKRYPLVIRSGARDALDQAVAEYRAEYESMFSRQVQRVGTRTMLDSGPRVIWWPGVGVIGVGTTSREARIAADIAEQTVRVIEAAERVGRYEPVDEADTFDMEYWSLEQAKLGKTRRPPMAGRIVLVTGAAGAIGAATARAFSAQGAELFLVDRDEAVGATAGELGAGFLCADLTREGAALEAVDACTEMYGGVDILVSNAGAAWTGRIGLVDEETLRASFELNFWSHQRVAQACTRVMMGQKFGGCLLFNVSKQAVNPGPGFAPYGAAKAALMFLVKQYAVDHGADGIRSNGVNADRIRSGLLDDAMIEERSHARGLSASDYMAGNLLGREVRAEDVAAAFVALALSPATTAHVMTVDGGNVAASLR